MDRRIGVPPASVAEQAQKDQVAFPHEGIQPLPTATGAAPYRALAKDVGIVVTDPLKFYALGDHGDFKSRTAQNAVSVAMQAEAAKDKAAFVYSLGDIDYFNGQESEYHNQFFEAYAHLLLPWVSIPGNHDGDTSDSLVNGKPTRQPLDAYMVHWCAKTPSLPIGAEEYNRDNQTQPNCFWTLDLGIATIIGLYTNVPSGGYLGPEQVNWLAGELAAAPSNVPVIITMHHPPYSGDAHHGGSKKMGAALDSAFEQSKRCADMVLSGHVHNYQRFTRTYWNREIPYVVAGAGGYTNKHLMAGGAAKGVQVTPDTKLAAFEDKQYGFLKVQVEATAIRCVYVGVKADGTVTEGVDTFTVDLATHKVT